MAIRNPEVGQIWSNGIWISSSKIRKHLRSVAMRRVSSAAACKQRKMPSNLLQAWSGLSSNMMDASSRGYNSHCIGQWSLDSIQSRLRPKPNEKRAAKDAAPVRPARMSEAHCRCYSRNPYSSNSLMGLRVSLFSYHANFTELTAKIYPALWVCSSKYKTHYT
jgi:hypothetical protein